MFLPMVSAALLVLGCERVPSQEELAASPPAMAGEHVCPQCRHHALLRIPRIDDQYDTQHVHPWRLTSYSVDGWVRKVDVEAYVCPRCGYTFFYAREPGAIVADGVHVVEVSGKPAGSATR